MFGRVFLALLAVWPGAALAADIVDATGRTVAIPDHLESLLA